MAHDVRRKLEELNVDIESVFAILRGRQAPVERLENALARLKGLLSARINEKVALLDGAASSEDSIFFKLHTNFDAPSTVDRANFAAEMLLKDWLLQHVDMAGGEDHFQCSAFLNATTDHSKNMVDVINAHIKAQIDHGGFTRPIASFIHKGYGSNHWAAFIVLPPNYQPRFGPRSDKGKVRILLLDSIQTKLVKEFPEAFRQRIQTEGLGERENGAGRCFEPSQIELLPLENGRFQQNESITCLYWSMLNIMRVVLTGDVDVFAGCPTRDEYQADHYRVDRERRHARLQSRQVQRSPRIAETEAQVRENLASGFVVGGFFVLVFAFCSLLFHRVPALLHLWVGPGNFFLGDMALVLAFTGICMLLVASKPLAVQGIAEGQVDKCHRGYIQKSAMASIVAAGLLMVVASVHRGFGFGLSLGLQGLIFAAVGVIGMAVVWHVTRLSAEHVVEKANITPKGVKDDEEVVAGYHSHQASEQLTRFVDAQEELAGPPPGGGPPRSSVPVTATSLKPRGGGQPPQDASRLFVQRQRYEGERVWDDSQLLGTRHDGVALGTAGSGGGVSFAGNV